MSGSRVGAAFRGPFFAGIIVTIALAGCAGAGAPPGTRASDSGVFPQPATTDEVRAVATVLQRGDEEPQLCLGGVAESLPPQCSGPVIHGWDWASVEQEDTAYDAIWGTYMVHGTWDGVGFTLTGDADPWSSADPFPGEDPEGIDEREPGASDEAALLRVQRDLTASEYPIRASGPTNGYLWVEVIFDDGSIQAFLDEKYGADVVVVQSALRPPG